jgi:hypothetical protein
MELLCSHSFNLKFEAVISHIPGTHSTRFSLCRQWQAMQEGDAEIVRFEEWVKGAVRSSDLDVNNLEDMDRLLLTTKSSQKATRYTRMKAYGNYFRMHDDSAERMQTSEAQQVSINYVGVIHDILKFDYGPVHIPIILLVRCEWIKDYDNRGNPTYTRDEAGFLTVNFRHKLPKLAEPFIFLSQAMQVFFSDVLEKPGWRVVLRKEARARREVVDTSDAFISTTVQTNGLHAPEVIPRPPNIASLLGAIELSAEDTRLASVEY